MSGEQNERESGQEPFLVPLAGQAELVRALVEPTLDAEGYELVHLQVASGKARSTVRFFIDTKDETRSIGIGDLERLNRSLGDLLDVEDEHRGLFRGAWDLEVSSPGVDRPLTKRSHFKRAMGQRIKVRTRAPLDGNQRAVSGALEATSDAGVAVLPDEASEPLHIGWEDIEAAHVVFEFSAPQKPQKKGRKGKSQKSKEPGGDNARAGEEDTRR